MMFPIQRYELIKSAVKESKFVPFSELLKITNSSLTTLRRDINYLEDEGVLKKTVGGVSVIDPADSEVNYYYYENREKVFNKEKEDIGRAAQEFIEERDIIILRSGTTTLEVAKRIDEKKRVTIITDGIEIVLSLRNKPNVEVILLGGVVKYSHNIVTGPTVLKMLDELHPNKMITGVGGITEEKGITDYDFVSSEYFKQIVEKIDNLIIIADYSKFGRNVLVQVAPLNKINTIITNEVIPSKYIKLFDKYHINYLLV
jgi:DeoR/GlpR family transcriptional regulator of sugar metabolism